MKVFLLVKSNLILGLVFFFFLFNYIGNHYFNNKNIKIIFNMKCSKTTLLKVSLTKYIKDDAPISVKIANFVKIISLENVKKWRFLKVSLLMLFKDDIFLSVIESINQRWRFLKTSFHLLPFLTRKKHHCFPFFLYWYSSKIINQISIFTMSKTIKKLFLSCINVWTYLYCVSISLQQS